MGDAKQTVVAPVGIVTTPKSGVYPPGSMKMLQNACIRNRKLITSFPAPAVYESNVASASYTFRNMWAFDDAAVVYALDEHSGTWELRYANDSTTANQGLTPTGLLASQFDVASAQMAFARSRGFLTSKDNGVMVIDSAGTGVRCAGFSGCIIYSNTISTTDPNAFANATAANYCVVIRRLFGDRYELIGEPSNQLQVKNDTGGTADPQMTVVFSPTSGISAGDFIDLYRTKTVNAGNDPGVNFFLSSSTLVTSAMVASTRATITDRQGDTQLGQELYTNPGRPVPAIVGVGGSYTNTPPGIANDVWSFRQQVFYAITKVNNYIKFRINGAWGSLSSNADRVNGIGTRAITGDTSNGSPTINNVNNMRGIIAGQQLTSAQFTGTRKILSIGASSITVDANATATQVGATITVTDVIEINGDLLQTPSFGALLANIDLTGGVNGSKTASIQSDQPAVSDFTAGATLAYANTSGITVVIKNGRPADIGITYRGSNPQNYSPPLIDINSGSGVGTDDFRKNRLQWSKPSQPEAVPPQQEIEYGNGIHYRGIPTKDCVWLFASDGLWRLSGLQDNYRVDPIDPTLILASRNAVCVLNQTVYAYTTAGLVRISANGEIDRDFAFDRVNDLLPGGAFSDTWGIVMTADTLHREVYIKIASFFAPLVYNEFSDTFYYVGDNLWQAATYSARLQAVLYGYNDRNVYKITDATSTQADNVTIDFQPILGDGKLNTLKQWVTFEPIWENLTQSISGSPTYNGNSGTSTTVGTTPTTGFESRKKLAVPRAYAVANSLRPGLSISGSGVTGQKWKFRGYASEFSVVSDDMGAR